ncbi:MAG TPA: hypothetical protein VM925_21060 [Labilithrix sp.]|nr:hypothetical protein [Labilithrix sp.]
MLFRAGRWDGPVWALVVACVLLAGALGCFGIALAVQSSPAPQAEILTTDNCPPPADL